MLDGGNGDYREWGGVVDYAITPAFHVGLEYVDGSEGDAWQRQALLRLSYVFEGGGD